MNALWPRVFIKAYFHGEFYSFKSSVVYLPAIIISHDLIGTPSKQESKSPLLNPEISIGELITVLFLLTYFLWYSNLF